MEGAEASPRKLTPSGWMGEWGRGRADGLLYSDCVCVCTCWEIPTSFSPYGFDWLENKIQRGTSEKMEGSPLSLVIVKKSWEFDKNPRTVLPISWLLFPSVVSASFFSLGRMAFPAALPSGQAEWRPPRPPKC